MNTNYEYQLEGREPVYFEYTRKGKQSAYPWDIMLVGDSFIVEAERAKAAIAAGFKHGSRHGKRYSRKTLNDGRVRITRVQ